MTVQRRKKWRKNSTEAGYTTEAFREKIERKRHKTLIHQDRGHTHTHAHAGGGWVGEAVDLAKSSPWTIWDKFPPPPPPPLSLSLSLSLLGDIFSFCKNSEAGPIVFFITSALDERREMM